MRYTRFFRALAFGLTLTWVSTLGFSQAQFTIPLVFSDSSGRLDTVHFGVHPRATNFIDDSLGESWDGCLGIPPSQCLHSTFCVNYDCLDGTRIDLRRYVSSTQINTYRVWVAGCNCFDSYPIGIHWQSGLQQYCDSMSLKLYDGRFNAVAMINMLRDTSAQLSGGMSEFVDIIKYGAKAAVLSVQENQIPNQSLLQQNYPNPFNPSTKIKFEVNRNEYVSIKVYDVFGREVAMLVDGRKPPGQYEIEWNAEGLASGVYFYRLQTDGFVSVKKMILMR